MFIVVLGGGIDLNGKIPDLVYKRLDKAIELYKNHQIKKIVLSGRYSFLYDKQKPPLTEADKMAQYLLDKNISKKDILKEKRSKDTIGNAYYLKKYIFLPHKEKKAIIITSSFHMVRAQYIFKKIFGDGYDFTFYKTEINLPKEAKEQIIKRQKELLVQTKALLDQIKDGNHNFLKGKIYKIKYYRNKRPSWVKNFVTKGTI